MNRPGEGFVWAIRCNRCGCKVAILDLRLSHPVLEGAVFTIRCWSCGELVTATYRNKITPTTTNNTHDD